MSHNTIKENYPILWEFGTSLAGAFSSDLFWQWINRATDGARNVIRTELPHMNRSLRDEALLTRIFEQLTDGDKKALERWLCTLGERQKEDFILSLAEVVDTPDDLNAKTRTPEERERALAAAVSYLRYLSALDDHGRRNESAAARRFMRMREEDYPQARDLLQRFGLSMGFDPLTQNWQARTAEQESRNDERRARIAQKRAELSAPMSIRERLRFFSLTGRN
jgi:hypothetical protein